MWYLIIGIFGLVVGSFLNVVINRMRVGENFITGRSRCPKCEHELGVRDLVPLASFFFLRGRCRHCGARISAQYPLVEFLAGLSFLALWWQIGEFNLDFAFNAVLAAFFIVVAIYDFKHYLILDKVVFSGLAVATAYMVIKGEFVSGIIGAVIVSGFFLLQYLASKGRWIGLGDVKLGLFLGMAIGFPLSIFTLFVSYMAGALVGLVLIAAGKKQLTSALPFGTFLALAAIFTLVYGQPLMDWYLGLIGIR